MESFTSATSRYFVESLLLGLTTLTIIVSSLPPFHYGSPRLDYATDHESQLAHGERLQLSSLDEIDIFLIPGMTVHLSNLLLVHAAELEYIDAETIDALQTIKGIGPVRAQRFAPYIALGSP